MRLRIFLIALLSWLPVSADELTDLAQEYVDEGAPGILITIQDADGMSVGRAGSIPDENALFRIASCSKMMTAALVLKACEERRLRLDGTLPDRFLDSLPVELPNLEEVTVRQLLSHRSGLPEYYDEGFVDFKRRNGGVGLTAKGALRYIRDEDADFKTGSQFDYNNTNYLILGLLVEHVYNRSLQDVAKEKIFRPLALKRSYFTTYKRSPRKVVPGFMVRNKRQYKASRLESDDGFGDGGVISTAADMTTFLNALLEGRILGEAMLGEMTKFRQTGDGLYGLGLAKEPDGEFTTIGHSGSIPAYQSVVVHYPELETTVVLFMNGGGAAEEVFEGLQADVEEYLKL